MTGMSETGQAELAKLKSRLNDERKKAMTLVAENDAARGRKLRNWRRRSQPRPVNGNRTPSTSRSWLKGLVQATAEKERLTELLKVAACEQARLSSEMEELAASAAVAGAVVRRKCFAGADRESGEARP